jgi:alkylation response protein AidB-like acyl-CoA dehydrogenase
MGVFSLRLPEAEGGVGLGMAEAVLVFAELGRRFVPGPLLWSQLAASLVPGAATGERIVGGLDRWHEGNAPLLVEYADALDTLLVLTRDGLHTVDARALEGTNVETPLDPLTPLTHIAHLPDWERVGGPEQARQLRLEGTLLSAALQLGIAEMTTELAVDYAKKREQFDRPIASFQSIKHLSADMHVRQEMRRARGGLRARRGRGVRHEERAHVRPDLRRHGIHLGDAAALLPEARLRPRRCLRFE